MNSIALHPPRGGPDLASKQRGFTLLEILAAMAILSLLLTLSAPALRHYWLLQSLDGAQGEVASQLRQLQARVASESHPLIFGTRFTPGTGHWWVIRYDQGSDRTSDADDTCVTEGGLRQLAVDVVGPPSSAFSAPPGVTLSKCGGSYSSDVFVMFYAKGTATGGTLTLRSEPLDRTRALIVSPLTGHVDAS